MTKIEAIKHAWGDQFPQHAGVSENGWSKGIYWYQDFDTKDFDTREVAHGYYNIRPKSLNGIENNNGWTKIESNDDLSSILNNADEWFDIIIDNKELIQCVRYSTNLKKFYDEATISGVTHWKRIQVPQLPIF